MLTAGAAALIGVGVATEAALGGDMVGMAGGAGVPPPPALGWCKLLEEYNEPVMLWRNARFGPN